MSTDLTTDERELFYQLITAAGTLATVTDNANTILSEEHQTLTGPSVDAVRAILEKCPAPPVVWDGELRETDLEISHTMSVGDPLMQPSGVKIVHLPTGIGVESNSYTTVDENEKVVRRALIQRLDKEFRNRG